MWHDECDEIIMDAMHKLVKALEEPGGIACYQFVEVANCSYYGQEADSIALLTHLDIRATVILFMRSMRILAAIASIKHE